jgi:2-amino-4-hydroxy-6-hydroxymethyldihydropteridine diphosphokinase
MSAPTPRRTVVLALGSNLGDRLANLQAGIDLLCTGGPEGAGGLPGTGRIPVTGDLRCTAVSGVYETAPVGGPAQDDYLNVVLLADSDLPGTEILHRCLAAEAALGRVRVERWGPRTLDVDVIAVGAEVSTDPALTLPHPRAHERAFVLAPWREVTPDARLPGHGSVADLLALVTTAGVRRLSDRVLKLPGQHAPGPAR